MAFFYRAKIFCFLQIQIIKKDFNIKQKNIYLFFIKLFIIIVLINTIIIKKFIKKASKNAWNIWNMLEHWNMGKKCSNVPKSIVRGNVPHLNIQKTICFFIKTICFNVLINIIIKRIIKKRE